MRLNMSVFLDWLKEYNPQPDIKSDLVEIDTVRLFSRNTVPQKNTIYVGKLHDLFKNGSSKVICTHNNDILLLNTDDVEEVLNCVLNAFEYYSKWNVDMLELSTSNAMLQDLLDRSEEVLRRPAFLLDSGQRMLAATTHYAPDNMDPLWRQMQNVGSVDLSFLLSINEKFPERFQKHSVYTWDDGIFPHKSFHRNFFFQDKWNGSATILDTNHTITQGELCIFELFCTYIDNWFSAHIQEQDSLLLEHQLKLVISDQTASHQELLRFLFIKGWKETDRLMFIQLSAPYQPYNINNHLCRSLNTEFSWLCAITIDVSICLLCNVSQKNQQQLLAQLLPWIQSSKYYGVYGPTFTIQDSFFLNYNYTSSMGEYCSKEPGVFYDGNKYILKYFFHQMAHLTTTDICHPDLKTLLDYDSIHHTDFFHTLYVYLQNERNHLETARALNLHRNSLSYRLNRLRELLTTDLDDPQERLHLFISYELLFAQKNPVR